jgi:hypothetical protein
MKAKEIMIERLESNNLQYRKPAKGDLVSRTFDTATGIFMYTYRDYDKHITVALWPEGKKAITTNKLMVWCEEDKKWKWIKP